MNGVLVIDKPAGPTSHDVVARVRRVLGTRRIGHTGTLDPLATGVLPLVIGTATRLASLLSAGEKEYVAAIRLGLATETYDACGRESVPAPPFGISIREVDAAFESFRGTFAQAPPPYSAKKIDGVRAYTLARKRTPVQPASARVTVHHLAVEHYMDGLVTVRVRASAGFYVRSLAHDLGQKLGCGAHLESLRRVGAGAFTEQDAVMLSTFETEGAQGGRWILPLEQLLVDIPAVALNERESERARHGGDVRCEDARGPGIGAATSRRRLFDATGRLVAIGELRPGDVLHPVIVLV
ncbi:MAG: tRNA pseudouridine(55) synthase TruB [Vicinamibacterales bacterium]